MKPKACMPAIVAVLFLLANSVGLGAENETGPSVFFPETRYEFSPVLEDTQVVHDFVIQNKGSATLTVDRVKTS